MITNRDAWRSEGALANFRIKGSAARCKITVFIGYKDSKGSGFCSCAHVLIAHESPRCLRAANSSLALYVSIRIRKARIPRTTTHRRSGRRGLHACGSSARMSSVCPNRATRIRPVRMDHSDRRAADDERPILRTPFPAWCGLYAVSVIAIALIMLTWHWTLGGDSCTLVQTAASIFIVGCAVMRS